MAGKKNVLSSLAVYAEDSEPESDGEAGVEAAGNSAGGLVSEAYGEDDFSRLGGDEDGYEEEEDENSKQSEDDDSETEKPEADDPKDSEMGEGGATVFTNKRHRVRFILKDAGSPFPANGNESWCAGKRLGQRFEKEPWGAFEELMEFFSVLSTASFSERVRNMSPDEIKIPPEPPGRAGQRLAEEDHVAGAGLLVALWLSSVHDKIQKLYERKIKEGMDMNYIIQRKKEFRNPSIYEKLIQFCAIDELGTNYPKDMFDPHGWSEDSYYEALAKAQKIEMDKLEKAKKERTKPQSLRGFLSGVISALLGLNGGKYFLPRALWSVPFLGSRADLSSPTQRFPIEFVTGTKKGTTTNATATTTTTASTAVADAQKRKSKWDSAIPVTTIAQPTILTTTATLPAVVTVTTSASGSKTTVISAVGTIVKKAKQ
ncbi:SAP30-binding protein [Camelus ferus]|nr:SAP30-binding protein [Camelus ferus]